MRPDLLTTADDGARIELHDPTAMPQASTFLWNPCMLVQFNCRGYVTAQHMQPEPAKYSHAPVLEQTTFMQPEQPAYAHHPGRFVYLKDEQDGSIYSAPYAPVQRKPDRFVFSVGREDVRWIYEVAGIALTLSCHLPARDAVELWTLTIENLGKRQREISVYPCFTIGYMSWMNQSAHYDSELGAVIATSITPYQKLEDYARISTLKDRTFLLHDTSPLAWETSAAAFEGTGGLHCPDGVSGGSLQNGDAIYETPIAVLQYKLSLAACGQRKMSFVFGPARDADDIDAIRQRYLVRDGFASARDDYNRFLLPARGCLDVTTPDPHFDCFVNHWLPRQVYYHGSVNRLTLDPQTRNYLQDNMGMAYIDPAVSRDALRRALAQQLGDGNMPEGVKLHPDAALKYINQVPHMDHCIWLPVCLQAYLDETGDDAFLSENIRDEQRRDNSVFERVTKALRWQCAARDGRGLSLIAQGDWCDPMNMVGPAGRGVSGWLSIALVHALKIWCDICRRTQRDAIADEFDAVILELHAAIDEHLWDGAWYARGITDSDVVFGTDSDHEGRIFLNPQSWALLANVASDSQRKKLLAAVQNQLETPFGAALLAPAYTHMREDIGRVTQKFPGTAENGAIYNHAAAFYIAALYKLGQSERAFEQLMRAIPGPEAADYLRRGQLPVFVPNYYRGAVRQFPRTAGRSSQLFNTGAASWMYRIVVEQLFGLRGTQDGLLVRPQLPGCWKRARVERSFRGAQFTIKFSQDPKAATFAMHCPDADIREHVITGIEPGRSYDVQVQLPAAGAAHKQPDEEHIVQA